MVEVGGILKLGERLGGDGREHLRGFASHLADAGGIFQGAGGALETEVEGFLLELFQTELEFVCGEFVGRFDLGRFRFGFSGCHNSVR